MLRVALSSNGSIRSYCIQLEILNYIHIEGEKVNTYSTMYLPFHELIVSACSQTAIQYFVVPLPEKPIYK
jgi:hypothetical protein